MTANHEDPRSGLDWSGAIADATDHVSSQNAEVEAAADARQRKPNTWLVVSLAGLLTVLMAVDLYLVRQPPEPLRPAEQEIDLRWVVADVVEEIEVFRQNEGRLPTTADLEGFLDEVISYQTNGSEYRVTAIEGTLRIDYDGSVPLQTWVTQRTVRPGESGS